MTTSIIPGLKIKKINNKKKQLKQEHPTFDFRFSRIAIKYFKSSFLFDIVACLPLLVFEAKDLFDSSLLTSLEYCEGGTYLYINLLSLLRVAMLYKVFASIIMIFNKLNEVYITRRLLLENIKNITIRCF